MLGLEYMKTHHTYNLVTVLRDVILVCLLVPFHFQLGLFDINAIC
jgi:hypothetical protein